MNIKRHSLGAATIAAVVFAMTFVVTAPASADTWPKGGAAPVDSTSDASVISIVENPDGTKTESIYTPAPGVAPETLAAQLTASGVPNVTIVDPSSDVTVLAEPCKEGTARSWASETTCFVRWAKSGFDHPQVDFIDEADANFPVKAAANKWDEAAGISVSYRPLNSCPGGGVHCIRVRSASYEDDWVGLTRRTLNDKQTYYVDASVFLNEKYSLSDAQERNVTCHEFGHVLGLDHNLSNNSCMYYQNSSERYPSPGDYALIERFY